MSRMKRWQTQAGVTMMGLGLAVFLAGCPSRPEVREAAPGTVAPPPQVQAPPEAPAAPRAPERAPGAPVVREQPVPTRPGTPESPLKDVFFDFDKAELRADGKAALDADVAWLKANGAARVTVEGHADERGTNEYNLALGERRAKAVKDYLVAAGINAGRITTISYGEERAFVLGHDESAWRWNRRGHFTMTAR